MQRGIILIFLFINTLAFAQKPKAENLASFDNKRIHFGFSLGVNNADFDLTPIDNLGLYDSIRTILTDRQPGFSLGIISNLHIIPGLDLRFVPALSFIQRNIDYTFKNSSYSKGIESTFLDFPVLIKYRSSRVNNFATYVLAGGRYSYDLASQINVENSIGTLPDDIILKLKKHDYSAEIGFGFDFFLEYFKLSPEMRVVFGIPNIIGSDGTIFSNPINKLNSRILLFSLNFEG